MNSTANRPPEIYLEINNLSKSFGSFHALNDISLTVKDGDFVCFLGPSGCGKTTLLRCIAGLETQSAGSILQKNCDISTLPPSSRDFGIVFQSYALFPNLTVFANIAYGLINKKWIKSATNDRVSGLLDMVGLQGHAQKHPSQLSGGEQQRVALARALATSPGLLLLDEPLSALDAKVRIHLRKQIKDLHRSLGLTTIMVTHDQEEAQSMADVIFVMKDGAIVQNNFYDYPVSRMTQVPDLHVHLVKSDEAPGGVGEPGLPPILPSITNAIFHASGTRVRDLPVKKTMKV